ncbi:MAG: bile acid:sodium symporter family protein [Luteibaculaceae bacterium]
MIPTDEFTHINIQFSSEGLLVMNISLAIIMFGVALGISKENFAYILKNPRGVFVGLAAQFLFLPALTFLLIKLIEPSPTLALGMIMVAACPGGNVSNFFSSLARGNVALSVSITGAATAFSSFMTPFNFSFWAGLYLQKSGMENPFDLSFWDMFKTVLLILIVPLVLGLWFKAKQPAITAKIEKPLRIAGILLLASFITVAFFNNFELFKIYIGAVIVLVFLHNLVAILSGYGLAALAKLPVNDRKSLAIETGIQNSGLGLIIIFNFFDGNGGMAMVAAWWGIWHVIAGFTMAYIFSRKRFSHEESYNQMLG